MRLVDADEILKQEHDIYIEEIGYRHRCIDSAVVRNAPTVDAVPVRHGKWLRAYGDHEAFGVRPFYRFCSECNEATVFPYNYCPNCGVKMDAERKEE